MLAPNLDPGSSDIEIGPAEENAIPATASFFQSIALSCFWSRDSVLVDSGSAFLDHANVGGKSVPLEEENI